jgi:glycosyltransferase involved in cell wall biosynthesis
MPKNNKNNKNDKIKIILITMIKNESKIIERALESVEDFVDGILVCDTGSTDNTVNIVKKYFKNIKKPTKICQHEWQNFGHNRSLSFTEAVKFCKDLKWNLEKTYGLLLDADQKLIVSDSFEKKSLNESGYNVMIKNESYIYYVPKLINLSKNWKCIGSTHEYWDDVDDEVSSDSGSSSDGPCDLGDELYVEDVGDGGCKSDKFERDIKLLMSDLKKEIFERTKLELSEEKDIFNNLHKNNSRTLYYLGQSYFDIKKWEDAIKWLSKRLVYQNNEDEEYQARLKIGISLSELDKPEEEVRQSFLKSFDMYPYMLEPIYYLMQYYMDKNKYNEAFEVGIQGLDIEMNETIPFITEPQIYNYEFKDDLLTICTKTKNFGIGLCIGKQLLKDKLFDLDEKARIKDNYYYCKNKLIEKDLSIKSFEEKEYIPKNVYIGIMKYDQSENLGDSYQSAAAMYIWWNWFGKPYDSFSSFIDIALQTNSICNTGIIWLNRDGMSEAELPNDCKKVITICNGWWMHPIMKDDSDDESIENDKFDFPLPDFVIPIYVSMHISEKRLLTKEAINHLKNNSPIGCRDLTTMNELKNIGIDAYFSGCLTSCLDLNDSNLGFKINTDYKNKKILVDVPLKKIKEKYLLDNNTEEITQIISDYQDIPRYIKRAVQRQYDLLHAKEVLTIRLHVWFPLIFSNCNVKLLNPNKNYDEFTNNDNDFNYPGMNRFAGILDEGMKPIEDRIKFRNNLINVTKELIDKKIKESKEILLNYISDNEDESNSENSDNTIDSMD